MSEILNSDLQLATAHHIRWLLSSISVTPDEVIIDGWGLRVWDHPEDVRFLMNGVPFDRYAWPLDSAYLTEHFPNLPGAATAGFHCRMDRRPDRELFPGGFARFSMVGAHGEHRRTYRTAWYLADPEQEGPMPSLDQIARVIGVADAPSFRMGGATIANRIDSLLRDRFDRGIGDFTHVLDWGCGAGRLTRYLTRFSDAVTGVDIDPDNIAGCRVTVPGAEFLTVPLSPPMPLADGAVDLVIGLSVMTHLREAMQQAWLGELRRITRPGGIVLLSVQGRAQAALYGMGPEPVLATQRLGQLPRGVNPQLKDVIEDQDYYIDMLHAHDFIQRHWVEYFDVLEIVEGIAGNQDLVILRRPA